MRKYKKYFIPAFALAGLIFALYMVFFGVKKTPVSPILYPPPIPPYDHYVAGSGMVEACSRNINIGVPFTNTVAEIYVKVGDVVKKDDKLFKLDTRTLDAKQKQENARKIIAQARYERLLKEPREEAIFPKEAEVAVAKSDFLNRKTEFELYDSVKDKRALSLNELNIKYYTYQTAKNFLKQKEDELSLLIAGAWIYDINIAQAEILEATRAEQTIIADIERSIIRAPIDGTVMQLNIKKGETTEVVLPEKAPIVFGCLDPLRIRVNVDETDAWRIEKNMPAIAYVRGNSAMQVELQYKYIEPYIIPKESFTGDNIERVDTRVLQIVYELKKGNLPIYPGQIMDVYIQAPDREDFENAETK